MVSRGHQIAALALCITVAICGRAAAQTCEYQHWDGCDTDSEMCCTKPKPAEVSKPKVTGKGKKKGKAAKLAKKVRAALPSTKASKACRNATPGECFNAAMALTDPYDAAADLGDACARGHGVACREIARRTDEGVGVAPSPEKAFVLLDHACTLGDAESCGVAGVALWRGHGTTHDEEAAKTMSIKGCKQGAAFACRNLGTWTENDNIEYASAVYQMACDLDAYYCESVARLYRDGIGRSADASRAVEQYTRACAAQNSVGCGEIAELAEKSGDLATAKTWYTKGCQMPTGQQWMCDALSRVEKAIADQAAAVPPPVETTPEPEPVPVEVTYGEPQPTEVPPEQVAAVDPQPPDETPRDTGRPSRKGSWHFPPAKLFGDGPIAFGLGLEASVAELGEPTYGSGAMMVTGEMGRSYRVRVQTKFFPLPNAIMSFGVGFHDAARYDHDMRFEVPVAVGWSVLSWPRADRRKFSLINLTVAGAFVMPEISVGVEVSNTTRLTCKAFVTVDYRHPLATFFADVPQLTVGLGMDLSRHFGDFSCR